MTQDYDKAHYYKIVNILSELIRLLPAPQNEQQREATARAFCFLAVGLEIACNLAEDPEEGVTTGWTSQVREAVRLAVNGKDS